jgi:hypothetical protein
MCLMWHKCMRACYAQLNIYNLSIEKYKKNLQFTFPQNLYTECEINVPSANCSCVLICFNICICFAGFVFYFVFFVVYYCLTLTVILFICHNMTRV